MDIEKSKLYSDALLPGGSKKYSVKVSESRSIFIFNLRVEDENATLKVYHQGPIEKMQTSITYASKFHVYYITHSGEIQISIINPYNSTIRYEFFVDISDPLREEKSKTLFFDGSRIAFHIDLRRGDTVSLQLSRFNYSNTTIRAFVLCYEIVGKNPFYMLCLYKEGTNGILRFTADLSGRYYIVIESIRGEYYLKTKISSPLWNQESFWIGFNIIYITIISLFFIIKIRSKGLEGSSLYFLIGCFFSFIAIGMFASVIGSFNWGVPISTHLFFSSIFFYGLSLTIQLYAAYLNRQKKIVVCPYCGRKVDLTEEKYCCGKPLKTFSLIWFFTPLSFSLLFFAVSYVIIEQFFPQFITIPLWIGSFGSILGGIIAWWINRIIGGKLWKFLATGMLSSFFFPLLLGLILDLSFQSNIKLELLGRFVRIRAGTPLLSPGIIIAFAILAALLALMMIHRIRNLNTNMNAIKKEKW